MFDWKRFLSDFGWAMAIGDPSCYAYYLSRPVDGHGRPHVSMSGAILVAGGTSVASRRLRHELAVWGVIRPVRRVHERLWFGTPRCTPGGCIASP